MASADTFRIVFSEDNTLSVEFSDEFLDSSLEVQMDFLKALLRERLGAPFSAQDVSKEAAENEISIVLLESFIAQLRRGERIQKGASVGLSLEDLEMPFNTWD